MATEKLRKALGLKQNTEGSIAPQYNGKKMVETTDILQDEATEADIIRDMKVNSNELQKLRQESPKFPIQVFPPHTRAILETFHRSKPFPIDYYGTHIMAVVGSLLGVGYSAVVDGSEHFANGYFVIVGDSSSGKTESMKPILAPLIRMEKEFRDKYQADMTEWRVKCDETRMQDGIKAKMPAEPISREYLLNNANIEGVYEMMNQNPRGIFNVQQEITAWVNMMNAYKSGDDEQFWINNWDSTFTKIRRVNKIMIIANPNCTVWGGIQPDKLPELVANNKGKSGFSARLVFAYPEDTKALHYSTIRPDPSVYENLYQIFKYLTELPDRIYYAADAEDHARHEGAVQIKCTPQAQEDYIRYFNQLADASNAADDDRTKSSNGKLQSYVVRFALIFEMLKRAETFVYAEEWERPENVVFKTWEDAQEKCQITLESMQSAIVLTEYFRATNYKVLQRMETPIDALKAEQQAWYKSLPVKGIKWSVAVKAAEKSGFKKGTANKLLNNTFLFKKVGEIYERRYV